MFKITDTFMENLKVVRLFKMFSSEKYKYNNIKDKCAKKMIKVYKYQIYYCYLVINFSKKIIN